MKTRDAIFYEVSNCVTRIIFKYDDEVNIKCSRGDDALSESFIIINRKNGIRLNFADTVPGKLNNLRSQKQRVHIIINYT